MLRPDPHVAQHSRREKLRVLPSSSPSPPLLHPLPPHLDFHDAASTVVPASCRNYSSSFLTQLYAGGGMWKPDWLLNNCEGLHLPSFPNTPYPLHDVITSSLTPPPLQQPMLHSGSELLLLPSFRYIQLQAYTSAFPILHRDLCFFFHSPRRLCPKLHETKLSSFPNFLQVLRRFFRASGDGELATIVEAKIPPRINSSPRGNRNTTSPLAW